MVGLLQVVGSSHFKRVPALGRTLTGPFRDWLGARGWLRDPLAAQCVCVGFPVD